MMHSRIDDFLNVFYFFIRSNQLLLPAVSGVAVKKDKNESFEMQNVSGSGIVQPVNELEMQPLNFDRALRHSNGNRLHVELCSSPTSMIGIDDLPPDIIVVKVDSHSTPDTNADKEVRQNNEDNVLNSHIDNSMVVNVSPCPPDPNSIESVS